MSFIIVINHQGKSDFDCCCFFLWLWLFAVVTMIKHVFNAWEVYRIFISMIEDGPILVIIFSWVKMAKSMKDEDGIDKVLIRQGLTTMLTVNILLHTWDNKHFSWTGICIIGNFTVESPNEAALNAVRLWIACGIEQGNVVKDDYIITHRQSQQPGYTEW